MPAASLKIGTELWEGALTKVTAPKINSFTATPPSVQLGQSAVLKWDTSGSNLVVTLNGAAVSADGSKTVAPSVSTTYELVAKNGLGEARASLALTVVSVPPPDPPPGGRRLIGGWRVKNPFSQPCLAIDFASMTMYMDGHVEHGRMQKFVLPAMGTGTDVNNWPVVEPVQDLGVWWAGHGYANGLCWWQNTLWVAPRVFYDLSPAPDTILFALDGRKITVPLPRQKFSGFVKKGPGLEPYLGCGGYESGQGSVQGPTLATLQGAVLIGAQTDFYGEPGPNLEYWGSRCARPDNTWYEGSTDANPIDNWVMWHRRMIDGQYQAVWSCDRIWGGGLVLPEGVCFWPQIGTGVKEYRFQTDTFAVGGYDWTYQFTFDKTTYALKGWQETEFGKATVDDNLDLRKVYGHELDAQGRVYLSVANAWASGSDRADPAIYVYE